MRFFQKLGRIETLVRHLVDHFNIPVNPDKRSNMSDLARPLDMARDHHAWMLYYALGSNCVHLEPKHRLTKRDIELDRYKGDLLKSFWNSCPSLPDNRVAREEENIDAEMDNITNWMAGRAEIFRDRGSFRP
jgi:hypothetical protein